jgi:hypothetical protein
MAKLGHHAAFGFIIYYLIWIFWKGTFIISGDYRYIVLLIVIFGIFPDFDTIYWFAKKRGEKNINTTEFQHHLYFWTHWPISYIPLIVIFIITLIFNFFPEYFLVPVVGIYGGHLILDSISCGDGIMWGKIPWKKGRYARYINLLPSVSDGYHGVYWEARYRKTFISKVGNIAIICTIIIISSFLIYSIIDYLDVPNSPGISGYYLLPITFFVVMLILELKGVNVERLEEPSEGRYADYRINPIYINGLSEKNQKKHIEKYKTLLEERGIIEQIKLK